MLLLRGSSDFRQGCRWASPPATHLNEKCLATFFFALAADVVATVMTHLSSFSAYQSHCMRKLDLMPLLLMLNGVRSAYTCVKEYLARIQAVIVAHQLCMYIIYIYICICWRIHSTHEYAVTAFDTRIPCFTHMPRVSFSRHMNRDPLINYHEQCERSSSISEIYFM